MSSPITSRGLLTYFYAIEFLAPLMEESDDNAGPTVTKASTSNAIKGNDESDEDVVSSPTKKVSRGVYEYIDTDVIC